MKLNASKIKEFILKHSKWIILFITLIIFVALTEEVFENEIIQADNISYQFISTYLITDMATPIAKVITHLGGAITLVSICVILFLLMRDKKRVEAIALNLILVTGLNLLLKNIVQRPRPAQYRLIDETGYSFPSGHSMVSAAFYGFLIYLIYQYIKNPKLKMMYIALLSILIIAIGISRIYLGVHYTSDVVAGFTISISYLIIYVSIFEKIREREKKDETKNQKNTQ